MSIVLAMMARAPAETVLRAIRSAAPYVDSVCLVVAPGDPLESLVLPIPGRIVSQPWQGYAMTRTMTLWHAEEDHTADWILMLDACARLRGSLPPLDPEVDAYEIAVEANFPDGTWRWMRRGHLLRARVPGLRWVGDIHEVLAVPDESRVRTWPGLVHEGAASGTRPYSGDVEILRRQLEADPGNTRAAFYFAQSLKDAGQTREAMVAFLRRAKMGGFQEETFWAWLWAGKLSAALGKPSLALTFFILASRHSPDRAEPLVYQAEIYRQKGATSEAELLTLSAECKPYPVAARLFVDFWCYSDEARKAAGIA